MEIGACLLIGVFGAVAFIGIAKIWSAREYSVYGAGLMIAALIYIVFVLSAARPSTWLAIEIVGACIYGTMAILGVRGNIWWLVGGWALHPVWDIVLHWIEAGAQFAPKWYVILCMSFDLVVASYLAMRATHSSLDAGAVQHRSLIVRFRQNDDSPR
jgi:hypothetical protein